MNVIINATYDTLMIGIEKQTWITHEVHLGRTMSEHFLQEMLQFFHTVDISFDDITQIYCVHGPGSFTGIRLSAVFANTLAMHYGIKLYECSLGQLFYTDYEATKNKKLFVFDARGKQVFVYRPDETIKKMEGYKATETEYAIVPLEEVEKACRIQKTALYTEKDIHISKIIEKITIEGLDHFQKVDRITPLYVKAAIS